MLAKKLESRAAPFSLRLIVSSEGRIAQAWIVMGLSSAIGTVVNQRFAGSGVPDIPPVGANEVAGIGFVLEELCVVKAPLV